MRKSCTCDVEKAEVYRSPKAAHSLRSRPTSPTIHGREFGPEEKPEPSKYTTPVPGKSPMKGKRVDPVVAEKKRHRTSYSAYTQGIKDPAKKEKLVELANKRAFEDNRVTREKVGGIHYPGVDKSINECNCCHCDSINKGEEPMTNKIEEIFKKSECVCPDCGGIVKSSGAKKGKGAKKLGNEMDPKAGKKSKTGAVQSKGDMKGQTGTGTKEGTVQRKGTQPSNPTVEKAMFPVNVGFSAAEYVGASEDNALSKSIEMNLKPGAGAESGLYVPPQRNLAMEQESARIAKAEQCSDDDSESDTGDEDESAESKDDGESSES